MVRRLPSLNALRCFEVVSAHLSIRKAAALLHVSESAVSRQVRILEEQLGVSLFARNHGGLDITPAGQRLAISVREAFDHIAKAVAPFRDGQDSVTLKVLPTFALRWLLPRLHRFHEQHPMIKVNVQTRIEDMVPGDTDADLGIRYGLGNWPRDRVVELYQEWVLPVCAPGHLDGPETPDAALGRATLLHPLPDRQDWATWSEISGCALDSAAGLDFEALDMALSAAEAGLGVAITDVVLAHESIEAGRLVPLRKAVPTGNAYYLVRLPDPRRRREVRLLDDWICQEIVEARRVVQLYGG